MKPHVPERRRYRRVYFDPKDEVKGVFKKVQGGIRIFTGRIMNISMNGLAFTPDESDIELKEGEIITITEINGRPAINFKGEIKLILRWVAVSPIFDRPAAGGEFVEIPLEMTDRLGEYLYARPKDGSGG